MTAPASRGPSPWAWVPSLYFAEGLPYVAVMVVSVVFYKNLGIPNTDIALYTSGFYLPWVVKPLWSPLVDLVGTKRAWTLAMQGLLGVGFLVLGAMVPGPLAWVGTLGIFWVLAFASATHDIAADGFYLLALPERQQAAFVGLRSTFYRAAMIAGQGGLVLLAGRLSRHGGPRAAWALVFALAGAAFLVLSAWHRRALPRPEADAPAPAAGGLWQESLATFRSFFAQERIGLTLAFLLTFRLGESQAIKLVAPFLLDPRSRGGLGLSTAQVGLAYGTLGALFLTLGGLAGGWAISRGGLRRWLWPMTLAVHVPNLAFVYLAATQPTAFATVAAAVALEQFGYGFGFTAYIMFLVMISEGPHRTAHYALGTGFMAMGMMLPGMASGWIQAKVGYLPFFLWVCAATLPSILLTPFLRIDPAYGRREAA